MSIPDFATFKSSPDYSHLERVEALVNPRPPVVVFPVTAQDFAIVPEEDFAAVMGVATARLGIWRGRGYGPVYVKLGKRIFYRYQDIAEWIESETIRPGAKEQPDVE